uniref:Immunoglobulin subtype domain-containing protein n=1 Tax=Amphiprion ocellaris TaxID=80972 RepID=A0AAQ5Z324_AMPOC
MTWWFVALEDHRLRWCCVKSNNMSGMVGHAVTLQCPYLPKHKDNRKFLCKGDHHKNCIDMVTSKSRFSMQDDVSSSLFLVTISALEAGDAGTYWCVSDSQWSIGDHTKFQLSVGKISIDVHTWTKLLVICSLVSTFYFYPTTSTIIYSQLVTFSLNCCVTVSLQHATTLFLTVHLH